MESKKIPRCESVSYCHTKFSELGMSKTCIHAHILAVRYLADFMEREGIQDYDIDVGVKYDTYLNENPGIYSPSHYRYGHRIVRRINDSFNNTYIVTPEHRQRRFKLIGEIGAFAQDYLVYRRTVCRVSEATIRKTEIVMGRFSMYCDTRGVTLGNLSRDVLIEFIDKTRKVCYSAMPIVGGFLHYLYENNIVATDYLHLFRNIKQESSQKVVKYYTDLEIKQIEDCIDRSTVIGKLRYAVVLLASRLGLRASDIAKMTFDKIDWEKCLINLTQYKTKKTITLPLTEDIGCALIDYIRNGRPPVQGNVIFWTRQQPYRPLTPINVNNLVKNAIKKSGLFSNGKAAGPHSLRHSLATNMINKGSGLPVISGILGHSSTETTKDYIAVNVTSLLKCSLDVPMVKDEFYTQEGGYFYGK